MPAKERLPDYYEILGIDCYADEETIKKAYRSLAKAFHPDTSIHPNAEERFRIITEAYAVLSNSAKRDEYDIDYYSKLDSPEEDFSDDSYRDDEFFGRRDVGDTEETNEEKDEFSIMADYEFYSDETEYFLIDGQKKTFENARHIIVKDTEYIIDGDEMIDIGGLYRFTYEGNEKFLIDGIEYRVHNAEHYYQGGCEYVIIEGKPYKIRGSK